jgi:gas vesicle protein
MSSNRLLPFVSFIAGLAVGALVALLYAPLSGEELRSQIRTEVDQRSTRVMAELDKTLKSLQQSIEQVRGEMKFIPQKSQAETSETPKS